MIKKVENAKYYSDFIDKNNEKTFFMVKIDKNGIEKTVQSLDSKESSDIYIDYSQVFQTLCHPIFHKF